MQSIRMPPKDRPNAFLILLSIVLLVAIAYAHVFKPLSISYIGDKFLNSLHGPGFTFVSLAILGLLKLHLNSNTNYRLAAAIAIAIAILSEAIQIPTARDASLADIALDLVGMIAGFSIFALADEKSRNRLAINSKLAIASVGLIALIFTIFPSIIYGYTTYMQYRLVPTLLSFENSWEKVIYRQTAGARPQLLSAPPGWPAVGDVVAFSREIGEFRTLLRVEPYSDWSNYRQFSFIAASANGASQHIQVTLEDDPPAGKRRARKYSEQFSVGSIPKRLYISVENIERSEGPRSFNTARVSVVLIEATDLGAPAEVLLDDLRLEQ